MKKILGLDLGTNSIGWALIKQDFENKKGEVVDLGSRIIPMSQDILGKFESGVSISQTAERTHYRSVRKLYQRTRLRRERLHRVLNILGFLPKHYAKDIDFDHHPGQFKPGKEPKLNYFKNEQGKYEFLFKDSFNEMVAEFQKAGHVGKIPYDWTIYYLRKKALNNRITKEELAWIVLSFNQKRGYYQLRDENEDSNESKLEEYHELKVTDIKATDDKNAKGTWYNVILENGWVYRRQSSVSLENWIGKNKEFIVTTQLEKDGSPQLKKDGEVKRSFRAVDSENDWVAIKTKTEQNIENSGKMPGEYIFDTLLKNPTVKIRGKLIRTIERKFYKAELTQILQKQKTFHPELSSNELFFKCTKELYPSNEEHRKKLESQDLIQLIIDDILFYQRPLKSQKSTISKCPYEKHTFTKVIKKKKDGAIIEERKRVTEGIKTIPKSHPLFQEFRLWQFINNLRIYKLTLEGEIDVTNELLPDEKEKIELFEFLNLRQDIDQKQLIKQFKNIPKNEQGKYRWNYVEDKKYPCNETYGQILNKLKQANVAEPEKFLTTERLIHLWHIIYSVKDKVEYIKALGKYAESHKIDKDRFVEVFKKFPPFKNDYGAYSQKAIKKLLPLMRMGKYWNENDIPQEIKINVENIKQRLEEIDYNKEKIDDTIADDEVPKQLLKSFIENKNKSYLSGLNTYQACYLLYGRHSELDEQAKWKSPDDIDTFLSDFKQHSLRNPIVEQVVAETLRTVRDIWKYYGSDQVNLFDEIHLELGRELKNPAEKRQEIARRNTEKENTNIRIIELLTELTNDPDIKGDIRPYSPSHQEILKIYEEGVHENPDASFQNVPEDEIEKIRKKPIPSSSEIKRYKLWLEQGYRSPYTGEIIPLSRLFTTDYQIEHIIPQARYFDNSLNNKVICESEINLEKSNQTAFEFIANPNVRKFTLSNGKVVSLFEINQYKEHCTKFFKKNRIKLNNLLSEDVPESFIARQLNDTRYISKLIKNLLNNIVRDEKEIGYISKNLLPVTGAITTKLKQDWGLNDKWNEIVAPRFKRMNELTNSLDFGYFDKEINAFRTMVPLELKRGFNKKRIDHRHHAMDALVVACTNRRHIQYVNSLNNKKEKFDLQKGLLVKNKHGHYTKTFLLPWQNFPVDAYNALARVIVSFKQNLRIINRTSNKTWQWVKRNGNLKKELVPQLNGDSWAVRKPLHKETISGAVKVQETKNVSLDNAIKYWESLQDKKLRKKIKLLVDKGYDRKEIKKYFKNYPYKLNGKPVQKFKIYAFNDNATATRVELSDKFTPKQLEKVTDSGIRNILERHAAKYKDKKGKAQYELAFSPEGVEALNKNIQELNNGKAHKPIYKVRLYETGNKFQVGHKGNKSQKYVEAAKGTNLYFAVYWDENKQCRNYETIPLIEAIEHQKQVASLPKMERTPVPVKKEMGRFLFSLSPNDLVYVPTDEEIQNPTNVDFNNLNADQASRIYKMVSSTGNECYFVISTVASLIKKYDSKTKIGEFDSKNKMEVTIDGIRIKEVCWKLEVDRLGNITKVIR